MNLTRGDCIRRQQDALAQILREPIEQVTNDSTALWSQQKYLENLLLVYFSRIPYCAGLYALDKDGIQITEYVTRNGPISGTMGWNHANQPYLNRVVPAWGFLLSDIYSNQRQDCPSLTAIQVVRDNERVLGYIGVDFDLRDLPLTSEWCQSGSDWTELTTNAEQMEAESLVSRKDSLFDRNPDRLFLALEDLLTQRGVFQCQLHFASNQVLIWLEDDPYQYRILDYTQLNADKHRPDWPRQDYPSNARIRRELIAPILSKLRELRRANEFTFLRHASINLFNGMINLGFSCDGSQYLYYEDFMQKNIDDWLPGMTLSEDISNRH